MHKFTVRRLSLVLAVGAFLLTPFSTRAIYAPPETPPIRPAEGSVQPVRPAVCPTQDPAPILLTPQENQEASPSEDSGNSGEVQTEPPVSPEATAGAEKAGKISALLAGFGLTDTQRTALHTRLAADSALLALLEQGELTQADLGYLALPNGRADRLDRYSAWEAAHLEDSPEAVVLQVNLDQDISFYRDIQTAAAQDSLTVLVNKHYALSAGYIPVLENLGAPYGSGSLRPEAALAFRTMADAARADGISLRSVSAYRSYQRQTNTYNRYLQYDSRASVDTYSARPGHSEHQTGLALDINVASIAAHFENTPAYAWLTEHCAQYGFILRYPKGKEGLTGYRFEPWHYRYVGTEAAKACMDQGLTYEEYLALKPEAAFLPQADKG